MHIGFEVCKPRQPNSTTVLLPNFISRDGVRATKVLLHRDQSTKFYQGGVRDYECGVRGYVFCLNATSKFTAIDKYSCLLAAAAFNSPFSNVFNAILYHGCYSHFTAMSPQYRSCESHSYQYTQLFRTPLPHPVSILHQERDEEQHANPCSFRQDLYDCGYLNRCNVYKSHMEVHLRSVVHLGPCRSTELENGRTQHLCVTDAVPPSACQTTICPQTKPFPLQVQQRPTSGRCTINTPETNKSSTGSSL